MRWTNGGKTGVARANGVEMIVLYIGLRSTNVGVIHGKAKKLGHDDEN